MAAFPLQNQPHSWDFTHLPSGSATSELPIAHQCPQHSQIQIPPGQLSLEDPQNSPSSLCQKNTHQQSLPTQALGPWLVSLNHITHCFLIFAGCALGILCLCCSFYLECTHPTLPILSEPLHTLPKPTQISSSCQGSLPYKTNNDQHLWFLWARLCTRFLFYRWILIATLWNKYDCYPILEVKTLMLYLVNDSWDC